MEAPLTNLPKKFAAKGHQIKPKGVGQRINPIKAIQDREWKRKQMAAAAAAQSASAPKKTPASASSSRLQCPNKACPNPNVVDGTCRTCGRVADDSNIVAEVSFGENAQGAAVVQGSFLSADQGGFRPMAGIGHRRVAGNGSGEARERTLREAKQLMTGYAQQLGIPEHTVTVGFQFYKLASNNNFVQGRKITNVVAVCLYAACRKSNPCRIMLIDLADIVKEEVFFLGRTFKKLLHTIGSAAKDVQPIYVEDLIFRFAAKLEFETLTNKVAETAVRLVQRMDRDWMVMGRRPAGICGACLIMAARMWNFRRTVREVVYIAKVTMATLQLRLDEFKELPSAKMTVEEFLAQDFLSEEYDPPAIYKKSEEYQARLREKRRNMKRKRGIQEVSGKGTGASANASPSPSTSSQTKVASTGKSTPQPRKDADGFVVPPLPQATDTANDTETQDRGIIEQALESENNQLDVLAEEYGDAPSLSPPNEEEEGGATTTRSSNSATPGPGASDTASPDPGDGQPPRKRRRGPQGSSCRTLPPTKPTADKNPIYLNEEWEEDEDILEMEISETINSPGGLEHAKAFADAQQRVQLIMMELEKRAAEKAAANPDRQAMISDNPEVDEDEFKDDPEVMYCRLSEEEVRRKELIWENENRAYMRQKQEKEFRAKTAVLNGTKRPPRRRIKKPKIGEGQTTPASTPGDAAVEAMERRGFSKRINYDAMRRMFDRPKGSSGPGSVVSGYTSHQSSRAGSSLGAGDDYQGRESGEHSVQGDTSTAAYADEDEVEQSEEEEQTYEEEEIDPFADDDGSGGYDDD